jgi:hypothetical protein
MAVQRKPWESLSPRYRERLERKGITPSMHAAGESIRAARGHERTPEHPREGVAKPQNFPDWFTNRQALVRRVARRKQQLFGTSPKWNGRRNIKVVNEGADGKHPPSIARLQWAIDASDAELMEALESRDIDDSFLFYH